MIHKTAMWFLLSYDFLDAISHLCKRVYPSVGPSACHSVGLSVTPFLSEWSHMVVEFWVSSLFLKQMRPSTLNKYRFSVLCLKKGHDSCAIRKDSHRHYNRRPLPKKVCVCEMGHRKKIKINTALWTRRCGIGVVDPALRTRRCGLAVADSVLRSRRCGLADADSPLRTRHCGLAVEDKVLQTRGCRLGVADVALRTRCCGRLPCYETTQYYITMP